MGKQTDFQRAQDTVAAYHESCLRELTAHVADAVDQYRAERIDAFDVEAIIHQYHQAVTELWQFCSAAQIIQHNAANGQVIDWWERGAPRRR